MLQLRKHDKSEANWCWSACGASSHQPIVCSRPSCLHRFLQTHSVLMGCTFFLEQRESFSSWNRCLLLEGGRERGEREAGGGREGGAALCTWGDREPRPRLIPEADKWKTPRCASGSAEALFRAMLSLVSCPERREQDSVEPAGLQPHHRHTTATPQPHRYTGLILGFKYYHTHRLQTTTMDDTGLQVPAPGFIHISGCFIESNNKVQIPKCTHFCKSAWRYTQTSRFHNMQSSGGCGPGGREGCPLTTVVWSPDPPKPKWPLTAVLISVWRQKWCVNGWTLLYFIFYFIYSISH